MSAVARIAGSSFRKRDILSLFGDSLVCRTDYPAAGEDLLHTVGSPAGHSCHGKQRSKEIVRDTKHSVYKTGVHIHIGAHGLFAALDLAEDFGRKAFDRIKQAEFSLDLFAGSQLKGFLFQDNGTRVGDSIYGMTHTIDESRAVICLFADNFSEIIGDFALVFPVFDICLAVVKHFDAPP